MNLKIISKNKLVFILLVFTTTQFSWCQNYSENENESNTIANTQLNGQQVSQSLFNSFFNTTPSTALSTVNGNSLSIVQASSFNTAEVKVAARASDIKINQNGNENRVGLFYKVDAVVTDIKQNGDENTVLDYVINPSSEVSLNIEQNGDKLTFDRFGANSITKNIKFTQTTASPTIIIRSFN